MLSGCSLFYYCGKFSVSNYCAYQGFGGSAGYGRLPRLSGALRCPTGGEGRFKVPVLQSSACLVCNSGELSEAVPVENWTSLSLLAEQTGIYFEYSPNWSLEVIGKLLWRELHSQLREMGMVRCQPSVSQQAALKYSHEQPEEETRRKKSAWTVAQWMDCD